MPSDQDPLDQIKTALSAAKEQATAAGAIATFLRALPVADGQKFNNVLMNPNTMGLLAQLAEDLDSTAGNHRPTNSAARAVPTPRTSPSG